jgi:hypothetical protein
MVDLRRHQFITLLGGAAATWPLAARAQEPRRLPTIGFFGPNTRSVDSQRLAAFVERLRRTRLDRESNRRHRVSLGEGRDERFAQIAAEFVRRNVDVIVTSGTPPAMAAKSDNGHPA